MTTLDFNQMIPEVHYYIHRFCTPNWNIEESIIDFIDITYVVKGEALYTIGGREYLVKKGDLLCIPQNTRRSAVSVQEDLMECYSANLRIRDLSGKDITLPLDIVSHIGYLPDLISQYHEIDNEWLRRGFGYLMKIRGLFLLILHQILDILLNEKNPCNMDCRIQKSLRYISEHYSEPLTINLMAELANLNPVYYGALFKESVGMTFKQYLNSIRLNYAENMLKSGEYSVGEVGLQCGFSDIFYFSKVFKEKRGICPSDMFISTQNEVQQT